MRAARARLLRAWTALGVLVGVGEPHACLCQCLGLPTSSLATPALDCDLASTTDHGDILSAIPGANTADNTTLLEGAMFQMDGTGKLTLPSSPYLSATDLGFDVLGPYVLAACFIPAGSMVDLYAGSNCPLDNPSVAIGGGSNSNGGTCDIYSGKYARMLNVVRLQDELTMFAEPTDALVWSWFQGYVYQLRFTRPQFGDPDVPQYFATGTAGDIVVLQKQNCDGVQSISPMTYSLGTTHSAKMVLGEFGGETQGDERGGAADVMAVARGKVNELPIGIYKICYATAQSEGNDQTDFKELGRTFEILPADATTPSVSVPRSLLRGTDIVVSWESTVNLQTMLQSRNSWIGLYVEGSCMGGNDKHIQVNQHECYIASQFIESGVQSGVVRFSQADYKTAGKFNVRFFQGDTRSMQDPTHHDEWAQGTDLGNDNYALSDDFRAYSMSPTSRLCRGMTGISEETYVECRLEPALISEPIEVFVDAKNLDSIDNIPGIEVVFDNQRARFQKGSRSNKMT